MLKRSLTLRLVLRVSSSISQRSGNLTSLTARRRVTDEIFLCRFKPNGLEGASSATADPEFECSSASIGVADLAARSASVVTPFPEYADAPSAASHWSNLMYRSPVAGIGKDRWRLLQLRQNVNGAAREMQRRIYRN